MSASNGRAEKQAAEPTYRRVAELVRAGMSAVAACDRVAEEEDRLPATVRSAYWSMKRRLEETKPRPAKAVVRPAVDVPRAVAATMEDSVADALEALAFGLAALIPSLASLEQDAQRWRDLQAMVRAS